MQKDNKPPFDPADFALKIRALLSMISISGADNIHNMDAAMQGLLALHDALRTAQKEAQEQAQREQI